MSEEQEAVTPVNDRFPQRTAGEVKLPSGMTYWMQTLNSRQRELAQEEATWAARRKLRRFREGGEDHEELRDQFKKLEARKQCEYLAGQQGMAGVYAFKAWEAHPDPPKPDADTSEGLEEFEKRALKWEETCQKNNVKRGKLIDKLYDQEVERASNMTPKVRLDACIEAWLEGEFQKYTDESRTLWTIRFAVRQLDDHRAFVYSDEDVTGKLLDLDDEDLQEYVRRYRELDSVSQRDVPTLPAES